MRIDKRMLEDIPAWLERRDDIPSGWLYIGDSEVDFATANNSNLPCISVLWGFRDKAYLEEIGAEIFAEEPGEILDILANWE